MAKTVNMRGLHTFITDIRSCQNKEMEQKRVEKELAKIRAKFGDDRSLTSYDKKKYVWKLLYIYMLGYDVEFGHKQACDLIPASKYSEKQVGYMACSILLNENDDFLRLAINAIHMDLCSRNEAFICLGLGFVGNVGGQEMAEALTSDVLKLLQSGGARPIVRKKSALTLLRLIRKTAVDSQVVTAETFLPVIVTLLDERDIGVLLSAITLLLGVVTRTGIAGYETLQPRIIKILERMVYNRDITLDYTYYRIASPWLQCKCLRCLQYFPPPDNPALKKTLTDIIQTILNNCKEGVKPVNVNESNAKHAILFEAVALCLSMDADSDALTSCVAVLGKFLSAKEANIKYLALEYLSRLLVVPEVLEAIRHHQSTIIASLKDVDISIRKRALDLLFAMCDAGSAVDIVQELVKYLTVADFTMREELVLKVAILAEKFAPDVQWYVDIALQLLERAGDFVSDDIWHRVVQLVTNNEPMQAVAASNVVEVLRRGAAHESLICVAAYVLGEYGKLLAGRVAPIELLKLLNDRFPSSSPSTKGLLLTAFMKLFLMDPTNPQLKAEISAVFTRYSRQLDAELQQRAVEYTALMEGAPATLSQYFLPMPRWEERESSLLRKLAAQEAVDDDTAAAAASRAAAEGEEEATPKAAASGAFNLGVPPTGTAPVAPQPSLDLLGGDLLGGDLMAASPSAVGPADNGFTAPAAPTNPLDALADLLAGPPAPQPAAPPSGPFDPFGAPAAPPPSMPAAAPAVAAGTLNPGFAAPGVAAAPQESIVVVGDPKAMYTALLTKEKGVLYEDTYLQIGLQAMYQRTQGRIMLFLGNKHATAQLTNVICAVPSSAALQVQIGAVPTVLAPKQQLQVPVQLLCLQPFLEPPVLQLGYRLGPSGPVSQQELQLPVLNHRFLQPFPDINQAVFFDHWKQWAAPPLKQQEFVDRATPLASESIVTMLRSYGFGVEHTYLDPSPHNEAGAANFVCGTPEQQYLCEVRVEGHPTTHQQFRVTVASPHPTLSATLKDLIVQQIRILP